MKLSHKAFYLITPIIIAPILLISSIAYFQLKNLNEERLGSQVQTLLNQISQQITEKISVAEANLTLLTDHQLLGQYALTEDESVRYSVLLPHLLKVFKNLESEIKDYYEIRFILPDGFEDVRWSGSDAFNKNEDISQDSYFEELRASDVKIFNRLIFDENSEQYALLMVRKLKLVNFAVDAYGTEPSLRGYVAITLNLNSLKDEISKQLIGESGYLLLLDNKQNTIFSPKNSESFNDGQLTTNSELTDILKLPAQNTQYRLKIDGQSALLNFREIPAELHLVSILPEEDMSNSARQLANAVTYVTFGGTFFALAFLFYILRKLVLKPIQMLNAAALAMGEGQLGLKIPIKTNDEIGSLAKTFTNMSENLKQIHEEVSYSANHDKLTGLPNRAMFHNHVTETIVIESKKQRKLALLFLDLDDFKQINDSLGHQAGDILLQQMALILSDIVRKNNGTGNGMKASDMVSRFAGDEFMILLNETSGVWDASAVADRILKALKSPILISGNQHYVSCSIGISMFPEDASNTNELIKYADVAMYHAKSLGKNHYQFYSNELNTDMQKRMQINARLRTAIDDSAFYLHYQPKVDSHTGQVVGLEALIRWNDSEIGQIGPDIFIKLAEESGLITPITEWVFDEVGRQINHWRDAGVKIVPVAINVSSIQFKRKDLVGMIDSSLHKAAVSTEYIQVELTESSLLTDLDSAIDILDGLEKLGIKVALDDFGTGYSSLSYLNKLPLSTLKIDKSFVQQIENTSEEYPVVDAIIALAHALDLDVVAEGVETIPQLEYMKARQCEIIQGYLFSRPLLGTDVTAILRQGNLILDQAPNPLVVNQSRPSS